MKENVSLPEFVSIVKESEGRPAIRFSEKEISPKEPVVGDEDSLSGTELKLEVKLEADTGSRTVVYESIYDNDVKYEGDMEIIQELLEDYGQDGEKVPGE
ncbi:hypothetical protein D1B31_04015 [Neobacillus notoginsengisoli]|uniref:Uncharacterized protein n=1 Tax=Neobacillus notoginsengisoli TaxID=1578198 RepID=A0A417YZ16_9BACI|nr:hypothetical protein [Neobacillus notoginsengisoli]RHW42757.1 hypothetical protein D1B31_04015 [Neobacillus notoginsengisoli]